MPKGCYCRWTYIRPGKRYADGPVCRGSATARAGDRLGIGGRRPLEVEVSGSRVFALRERGPDRVGLARFLGVWSCRAAMGLLLALAGLPGAPAHAQTMVTVSFDKIEYPTTEGAMIAVGIGVKLDTAPGRQVIIPLTTQHGSGATTADYQMPDSVTFGANRTYKEIEFRPQEDTIVEQDETVTVSFGTPLPAGVQVGSPSSAVVTIHDNNTVTLTVSPASVEEGNGPTPLEVTGALRYSFRSLPTDVVLSVSAGTATESVDYTADTVTLTIPANEGDATATLMLTPTDDQAAESTETVTVEGAVQGGGFAVTPATVTIRDDDVASTEVILAVSPSSVSEGDGSMSLEVTGTLNNAARLSSTVVSLSMSAGTASTSDYTADTATLTIPANEEDATATLMLTPTDDQVVETDETVTVEGVVQGGGLTVTPATVTIHDDDVAPPTTPSDTTRTGTITDAPQYLRATTGDSEVTLTWDAPFYNGGSEIAGYGYRYKENGSPFGVEDLQAWEDIPGEADARNYTVTGLTNGVEYRFEVRAQNAQGGGVSASVIAAPSAIVTSAESEELPSEVALIGNYPNPFNPETVIDYALAQTSHIRLAVYDMTGKTVAVLMDGIQPQGRHTARFKADGLPTGTYVYRLTAGAKTLTRTMTLVR